uniref:Uncharacterized protein n=1 Tax=Eutreptiella gymnastica TaxID=73025 RepID=A0A7S4CTW1_9EUGL
MAESESLDSRVAFVMEPLDGSESQESPISFDTDPMVGSEPHQLHDGFDMDVLVGSEPHESHFGLGTDPIAEAQMDLDADAVVGGEVDEPHVEGKVKVKSSWKDSMMRLCERRHRRYVELFGENPSPPPQDAWVKDNELFICHATRQVFTTTAQVRDHATCAQYTAAIHDSGLAVDHELLQYCETHARAEKEKLKAAQAQKQESEVKAKHNQLEAAKQQAALLAKENRQLTHTNWQLQQKVEKLTRQVKRQQTHSEQLVKQILDKKAKTAEKEAITIKTLKQQLTQKSEDNKVLRQEKCKLQMELHAMKKHCKKMGVPPPPSAPAVVKEDDLAITKTDDQPPVV